MILLFVVQIVSQTLIPLRNSTCPQACLSTEFCSGSRCVPKDERCDIYGCSNLKMGCLNETRTCVNKKDRCDVFGCEEGFECYNSVCLSLQSRDTNVMRHEVLIAVGYVAVMLLVTLFLCVLLGYFVFKSYRRLHKRRDLVLDYKWLFFELDEGAPHISQFSDTSSRTSNLSCVPKPKPVYICKNVV
jgi:hypothetical protein